MVGKHIGSTSLVLAWDAARDDVAVTGYRVFRDTVQVAQVDGETRTLSVVELDCETTYAFRIEAGDASGHWSTGGPQIEVRTLICQTPPDPALVAPELPPGRLPSFLDMVSFLFSGDGRLQEGVIPGDLEPRRVSVVQGQVRDASGAALPGVRVSIKDHPELGYTQTRNDGGYDLAVNGGGSLILRFSKPGFLPADRGVLTPWNDFVTAPTVRLCAVDPVSTVVDLAGLTSIAVARGSVSTDAGGPRQPTFMFSPGTEAAMVFEDGSRQSLTSLTVRATEYTVGESGTELMPAPLPPQSGYTYAAEYSVDEAMAAGATSVQFSKPVVLYLENFIGAPVGTAVPTGYYDRNRGTWIAAPNGRVVEVLEILPDTSALIDTDGDGLADPTAVLDTLAITHDERVRLGGLYSAGQTLWRVPISHFTPYDHNWPYGPPTDASCPYCEAPPNGPGRPIPPDKRRKGECAQKGSVITCETQVLGESLPLVGTPFQLHYASDRVSGYLANRSMEIPLTGDVLPAGLRGIVLQLNVAGQHHEFHRAALPRQSHYFVWDGRDKYGRLLPNEQPVHVKIGYTYVPVYYPVAADFERSFGRFAREPSGGAVVFQGLQARNEIVLWQDWQGWVGQPGSVERHNHDLGGWTLSEHHAYDPRKRRVIRGDGQASSPTLVRPIIERYAGVYGERQAFEEHAPTPETPMSPQGMDFGPDGSLYFADDYNQRVRKIAPDGTVTTVAGCDYNFYEPIIGDGGPATEASIIRPWDVAVGRDGSVYVVDTTAQRVRKITPDGIIDTVAGGGTLYPDDGLSGKDVALVGGPEAVAAGVDDSVYFLYGGEVFNIGPDGILTVVAGRPGHGPPHRAPQDGDAAYDAYLHFLIDLDVGPDGALYLLQHCGETSPTIWRIDVAGRLWRVAGGEALAGLGGDGGPALEARFRDPASLAVGPIGEIYVADTKNGRLRVIDPFGIVHTLAGSVWDPSPENGEVGDGGFATDANLPWAIGIAVSPEGEVYVSEHYEFVIRRIHRPGDVGGSAEIVVKDDDRQELYVFSPGGLHLRTLDALTLATRFAFSYDENHILRAITDVDGNEVVIERTSATAISVMAANGWTSRLELDGHGYLSSLTTPGGAVYTLAHSETGLLQFLETSDGPTVFSYYPDGRLEREESPAGNWQSLSRSGTQLDREITRTNGLAHRTVYRFENLLSGERRMSVTKPSGASVQTTFRTDGTQTIEHTDGTIIELREQPSPHGSTDHLAQVSVATPAGRHVLIELAQTTDLADERDLTTLIALTRSVAINGAVFTSVFDAATRTFVERTAEQRETTIVLDATGRTHSMHEDAALLPTIFSYTPLGLLERVQQGGQSWTYTYDGFWRPASVTDALGRTTRMTYDASDGIASVTTPGARQFSFEYGSTGRLVTVTMPSSAVHSLGYTPDGLLQTYSPPQGGVYLFEYNAARDLETVAFPSGQQVDWAVSQGWVEGISMPQAQIAFSYRHGTDLVRTVERTPSGGGLGQSLHMDYDGQLLTGLHYEGATQGVFTYTYDAAMQLASVDLDGDLSLVERDADGLVNVQGPFAISRNGPRGAVDRIDGLGFEVSYAYDALGRVWHRRHHAHGLLLYEVQLTRDDAGRIVEKIETVDGVTAVYGFAYDADNQLVSVTRNGGPAESYAYDLNGNRLSRDVGGEVVTAEYDVQDRIRAQGGVLYAVNEDGFVRERGPWTFTYSAMGELLEARDAQDVIAYDYDGLGRRVRRSHGATSVSYLYGNPDNPFEVSATRDQDGVLTRYFYDDATMPYAMRRGGLWYAVACDQTGSVRAIADAAGQVVKVVSTTAFGELVSDSAPGFRMDLGYAGGLADPITGWVRFGYRDYDPLAGRWTARDPGLFWAGAANLYVYVGNSPVNLRDPSGLFSVGASWYSGFGGGFKVAVTMEGFSVCAEGGLGAGAGVEVNPFGGLDPTQISLEAEAGVGVGAMAAKYKTEINYSKCHGFGGDVGVEFESPLVTAEASLTTKDVKAKAHKKFDISGKPKPKFKTIDAQAKVAIKGCVQRAW